LASIISQSRLNTLRTTGTLIAHVPRPLPLQDPIIRWVRGSPDDIDNRTDAYVDGSIKNAKWTPLCTAGAAIVIVNTQGHLIAAATIRLPSTVATAAEAELWAVDLLLALTPVKPRHVFTDCKSILTSAKQGRAATCSASSPLAASWTRIAASIDDDYDGLLRWLVWAPAHQSATKAL
jgi:hypothetical protein